MQTGKNTGKHQHGGDALGFEEQYGRAPLDVSANVNPLGLPPGALRAARQALEQAAAYPDPQCRRLRTALAARHNVGVETLLCGNGAADLIYRLMCALRPRRALLAIPCFAEYENALRASGCSQIEHHRLLAERQFCLTEDILPALHERLDMLVLTQPNNPTAQCIDGALLHDIAWRCERKNITLLLDECFLDFVEGGQSMIPYLSRYKGLFILKAFTKYYGMAGLRLGYILGDGAQLERLACAGPPWAVSNVAEAAGLAALEDRDFEAATREWLQRAKPRLLQGLESLGIAPIGAAANYVFFGHERADLAHCMAQKGVAIRDCSNFDGLEAGYYRMAIRSQEENERVLQALQEVLTT